jgi:serine phosphatase RsbU (regulator of sigma subunit)
MGPLPADEQLRRLEEALAKHQGQAEQRDDITVMGIRV